MRADDASKNDLKPWLRKQWVIPPAANAEFVCAMAFPAAEARRLAARFEVHDTPKHGSWLDMAETELSVLSRQCLDRRIDDAETLAREIAAWERRRNAAGATVDW